MSFSLTEVLDLIEEVWLPMEPPTRDRWARCLEGKDLWSAVETLRCFENADRRRRPSIRLFEAAYVVVDARRPRPVSHQPGSPAFIEALREKLRRESLPSPLAG